MRNLGQLIKQDQLPVSCLTVVKVVPALFKRRQLSPLNTNIDRGTVVYMAPELLVEEKIVPCASIDDLILSDVWALGMIVFTRINPSLKCRYILDIRSAGGVSSHEESKKLIIS